MLSKQIEKAQKKVEEQHFLMRKHTLEYDDVLNEQREVIYNTATRSSRAGTWASAAREEIANLIERLVDDHTRRRLRRGLGRRRALRRARGDLRRSPSAADVTPTASTARS